MKAAMIAPSWLLRDVQPHSDYHLILTHKVIHDRFYCDFYRERSKAGDFILLDNSAVESGNGRSRPMKEVALAAMLVRPSVVFMPDRLFDGHGSLDELESAMRSPAVRTMRQYMSNLRLGVVVQGLDADEWLLCFDILNKAKGIDVLGIPMLTTHLFGSRLECLKTIRKRVRKQCHLLGVWKGYGLDQVRQEASYPFVLGVDTGKPVRLAIKGQTLDSWCDLKHEPGYLEWKFREVDKDLLGRNCEEFVGVCNGQC